MAGMRRKGDFPSKLCLVCGRPFVWRRKWAKVWDEVRYCSDACRRKPRPPPLNTLSLDPTGLRDSERPSD